MGVLRSGVLEVRRRDGFGLEGRVGRRRGLGAETVLRLLELVLVAVLGRRVAVQEGVSLGEGVGGRLGERRLDALLLLKGVVLLLLGLGVLGLLVLVLSLLGVLLDRCGSLLSKALPLLRRGLLLDGRLLLERRLAVEEVEAAKLHADIESARTLAGHDDGLLLGSVARALAESWGSGAEELLLGRLDGRLGGDGDGLDGLLDGGDGSGDLDRAGGGNVVGGKVSLDFGEDLVGVRRLRLGNSGDRISPAFADTERSRSRGAGTTGPGIEGSRGGGLVPCGGGRGRLWLRLGDGSWLFDDGLRNDEGGSFDGGRSGSSDRDGRRGRGRGWLGGFGRAGKENGKEKSVSSPRRLSCRRARAPIPPYKTTEEKAHRAICAHDILAPGAMILLAGLALAGEEPQPSPDTAALAAGVAGLS